DPTAFGLGGERREISLLFTDITGFTTLAETMPPSQVLQLLNAYFEELCGCVHAQQGIVADLIGDAVFAIFGAPIARPDHARRALVDAAGDRDWRPLAQLVVKGRRAAIAVVECLPPEVAAEGWLEEYRRAYALLEAGSRDALAALSALAAARPDDGVIRFHR